jgi:hypothetical protein
MPLPEGIVPSLNSSEIGELNPESIFIPSTSTVFSSVDSSYNYHISYSNWRASLPLEPLEFYGASHENITPLAYETVENSLLAGSIGIDGRLFGGSNIEQTDVITGQ